MLGWDFEASSSSRFWRWDLIKICVRTCDMTHKVTLVSWTQPSCPLCLWQCLAYRTNLSQWSECTFSLPIAPTSRREYHCNGLKILLLIAKEQSNADLDVTRRIEGISPSDAVSHEDFVPSKIFISDFYIGCWPCSFKLMARTQSRK